jgi:hypothetical protein
MSYLSELYNKMWYLVLKILHPTWNPDDPDDADDAAGCVDVGEGGVDSQNNHLR